MKNILTAGLLLATCATFVGCKTQSEFSPKAPTAITLPGNCDSPDGMTLAKDGNIYLSMNGTGIDFKFKNSGKIMRITKNDKLEEVFILPKHPKTKVASPMGLVFAKDGNLYVSDNQSFAGGKNLSRLLKLTIKGSKVVKCETVAEGFMMSNGITTIGDYLYINETNIDASKKPMISGVYRFKLSELDAKKPIKVTGVDHPNFFLKVETNYKNDLMKVGANGIAADSKGNLFICNFGEASILKVTLKENGEVNQVTTLCKGQGLESTDGLQIDSEDNLWVADFMGNAVACVDSQTGKVTIIAKNAPGNGDHGQLDAPSECIRRGDKLYVSNIDITYGPNKADEKQNISVIILK